MTSPVRPGPSPSVPDRLFLDFQSVIASRYSLERELGRGGMGIVFLARDLRLERVVAVKLLPPECARNATLRERFVREARMAAKLSHPNIIAIHAVEESGDFVFFVMSYIEGETLGARVRREGSLKPHDAARILREVAWALAYAHAQGVIHRDVKPDNVLLETRGGRALVADFGIARLVQATGVSGEGEIVGTPEYMSPEQASGEVADGRSDLYALGVVGYFALSGRLPFTAPTVRGLLVQHVTQPPPPLVARGAPRVLTAAIERCLAKDPSDRFQTGEGLADALAQAVEAPGDLPVPVRAFLAQGSSRLRGPLVGPLLLSAFLVPSGLAFLLDSVFSGPVPPAFRLGVIGIGVVLGVTALASPLAIELRRIRRLLGSGYAREDLLHALTREVARRREEQEYMGGAGPGRWERLMRFKSYGSLALAAGSAVAAFFVPYPAILAVLGLFGLSCATAVATGVAALAASRRRLGSAEEGRLKFWRGRLGRWLFQLAGLGLRKEAIALPPADRPTEMALGLAALDLFEALSEETRRALGDVPAAVRGLEDDARRLRAAAQDSGPAREVAQGRLREALAGLENIRLDLLRLHGGLGSVDGLTQDLEAAEAVGRDVDRLLEGIKETDRDGQRRTG
jgi:eukaryotic-like serine/threonine-protein kinase